MAAICLIVQNYYDIDPRVRRKAEGLVEAGFQVDVIALKTDAHPENPYFLGGVRVFGLPVKKQRGSGLRYIGEYLAFFWGALLKLAKLNAAMKYAVVDVNTLPDFLVFSAWIARRRGAKVVLDMHEVMPEFYMSKYSVPENHWMIRLLRLQERLSMRFADHVLVINEPIQQLLLRRGLTAEKNTILVNSVDERLFLAARSANPPTPKPFVFSYHGTLTNIYGLDIALKGFAHAYADMPDAEFRIIGDGPERERLEALSGTLGILEKVKFLGSMPQQEVAAWLGRCHVGVLATRQDQFLDLSFSNKLPEYIVMGKPVIASRLRTVKHYFSEKALVYFEPHNVEHLAARMIELYRRPDLRDAFATQAEAEYEGIRWNVMRDRYINLIRTLSNEH